MSKKRFPSLLVASLLCSVFPASISWSQSDDTRCSQRDSLLEAMQNCDDQNAKRKLNVDPSVTNSVRSDSNNTSVDDNNTSNNNGPASNNDGTTPGNGENDSADVSGDADHDNGHGNDPDHDDSSNPGQGGGNHGADK